MTNENDELPVTRQRVRAITWLIYWQGAIVAGLMGGGATTVLTIILMNVPRTAIVPALFLAYGLSAGVTFFAMTLVTRSALAKQYSRNGFRIALVATEAKP